MAGSSVFLFHRPNLMDCHGADKVGEVVMRVKIARVGTYALSRCAWMLAPLVMLSSVRKVATRFANQSLPEGEGALTRVSMSGVLRRLASLYLTSGAQN